jgi:type I restriction enzyme, S subunit
MVPNGWKKVDLGSLFDFKNGLNTDKEQYGSGYKFVNVMDVFGNDILTEDKIIGQVQVSDKELIAYKLHYGDVLFNRTSETFDEIAMAAVYLDNAVATFGGFVIRGRPKSYDIYPEYSAFLFQAESYRTQAIKLGQGAVRANIGQKDLAKVNVLLPSITEQKEIAQILYTWDQAILATEKLLENSQQQKKALMQQLLTGKKRLLDESGAQFDGEWKLVKVSNLLKVRKERQVPTAEVPLFSLTIENGITPKSDRYNREFLVKNTEEKKYKVVRPKDIVYNPANLRWGAINFSRLNHSVVVSPIYEVLYVSEKDKVSLEFIAQKLMTKDQINRFAAMVEGTLVERMAVKIEPFLATKLSIPPSLKEQQAIAIVLSKADQQIELLQKKLDCLKQEKKALMQQLLTGKKRVKVAA